MLNREEIRRLIKEKNLITGYIDLEKQLTPNGFDLSVDKIFEFVGPGKLDFSNKERMIPAGKEVLCRKEKEDKYGWWYLEAGIYKVRTNEVISLPEDLVAIGSSRSSLLRMGAFVVNGVWDVSFKGKSEFVLVVGNKHGIRIKKNARLVQMIFFYIKKTQGYDGIYQGLGLE